MSIDQTEWSERNSLRTLFINFQSIHSKKVELWNLLGATNPDIIIGCERWLKQEISDAEMFAPTFSVYRTDRLDGQGGVLIAVKKNSITHQLGTRSTTESVLANSPTAAWSLDPRGELAPPILRARPWNCAVIDSACGSKHDVAWLGGDLSLPDIK